MQYKKKNTAFDSFEPTTVLHRMGILGKELTFVDRCVLYIFSSIDLDPKRTAVGSNESNAVFFMD